MTARLRWIKEARPDQLTPPGDWRVWLIMAGRGWGKTRTGAEDIAHFALWNDRVRVGVIAPTFADARDVCMEGESGLLRLIPPCCIAAWHRSTGDLLLSNGSRVKLFSADQPERLRGPQHHRVWCDELAAWPRREAFEQLWFGLRLGKDPRVVVTTTPRNTPLMRDLLARRDRDVFVTHGRTMDNVAHLSPQVIAQLQTRYAGTKLGRQELDAELLEDDGAALWKRAQFDAERVAQAPAMARIVVAVDPALTQKDTSDETGIVAAGRGVDGAFYVLADASGRWSPEGWASKALELRQKVRGDVIVAEVNAGGDLVERLLRQRDPQLVYKGVRALRGKVERALPVAALYEQGRVHHVGCFALLEDQMCDFTVSCPAEKSPDRVDALVWALTELSEDSFSAPRVRRL